jgi:hypothetical protein
MPVPDKVRATARGRQPNIPMRHPWYASSADIKSTQTTPEKPPKV